MDVSTNGDHFFFTTRGRRGVVVSGGWAVSGEREELDAIA